MRRFAVWSAAWTLALALAVGAGCASEPRPVEFRSNGPSTADGLYRVRAPRVSAAFVRPGADFSNYDGLRIDPVTVSYTGGALDDSSLDRLKRIFQESLERQLGRSKAFTVVSKTGPNVLRVSGRIVNLHVDVPRFRGGELNFVLTAGEMTLILDVRDSRTGTPLGRMADRRNIVPASGQVVGGHANIAVNNWGAVREICNDWARILRYALDDLHQLPIPPPPSSAGPSADEP